MTFKDGYETDDIDMILDEETAKFYIRNIVPEIFKTAEVIKDCDTSAIDILEEGL